MPIKKLKLERFAYSDMGTFGELFDENGEHFCWVCEEVWHNNRPSIEYRQTGSCIPVGTYTCRRGKYPRHGDTFEVLNVPGRTAILFHVGNTVADIEGCLALGNRLGALGNVWSVLESGGSHGGYTRFMRSMVGRKEFELEITNRVGGVL